MVRSLARRVYEFLKAGSLRLFLNVQGKTKDKHVSEGYITNGNRHNKIKATLCVSLIVGVTWMLYTKRAALPQKTSYVMYVSDYEYLQGALVNSKLLKLHKCQHPITIAHSLNLTHEKATGIVKQMDSLGVRFIAYASADYKEKQNQYYKDVMLKLVLFNLIQFDRVVYVESDGFVLKNLDSLFAISLQNGFAAPEMHWGNGLTSILMVIEPTTDRYLNLLEHDKTNSYDMDVLNNVYKGRCTILPCTYGMLNGALADKYPIRYKRLQTWNRSTDLFRFAHFVHFTSVGKPWNHPLTYLRRHMGSRDITPTQLQLWQDWYYLRDTPINDVEKEQIGVLWY